NGEYRYQVQWQVQPDASWEQAARQIHDWHAAHTFPADSRGLSAQLDFASYCEWYCPEEKVFCDYRLSLYSPEVLKDYVKMSEDLSGVVKRPEGPQGRGPKTPESLHALLHKYKINHIIRTDRNAFASHWLVVNKVEEERRAGRRYYDWVNHQLSHTEEIPAAWRLLWENGQEWPV